MKHSLFDLTVSSPEKQLFSGKVESLAAKAVDGEIGIFANHAPLISILRDGPLKIQPANKPAVNIPILGGVMHVEKNTAEVYVSLS